MHFNSGLLTQTCCCIVLYVFYPLTLIPLLCFILFPPCLPALDHLPSQCSSPLAIISQSSPVEEFSESSALSSLRLVCLVFTYGTLGQITFPPGQALPLFHSHFAFLFLSMHSIFRLSSLFILKKSEKEKTGMRPEE